MNAATSTLGGRALVPSGGGVAGIAWQIGLLSGLERAGVVLADADLWHDLRHTWASWHAQNGTPLNVLQDMGGWESESMVRRYAHLAPAQLKQHAETVAGLLGGTNLAQPPKKEGPAKAKSLNVGGPTWTRTRDQRIMSPLL